MSRGDHTCFQEQRRRKWVKVFTGGATGGQRRKRCRRDDGCVGKREMPGQRKKKVPQGRKEWSN